MGILGKEGQQAARASDYALSRFRFLVRLLLVHGRYSYQRTALITLYSFYKSFFIALMALWYSTPTLPIYPPP